MTETQIVECKDCRQRYLLHNMLNGRCPQCCTWTELKTENARLKQQLARIKEAAEGPEEFNPHSSQEEILSDGVKNSEAITEILEIVGSDKVGKRTY